MKRLLLGCALLVFTSCSGTPSAKEHIAVPDTNCDGGESCFLSGNAKMMYGEPAPPYTEPDLEEATAQFVKSCNYGFARGCNAAGKMFHEGLGVERDLNRAKHFYGQACEKAGKEYPEACHNVMVIDAALVRYQNRPK